MPRSPSAPKPNASPGRFSLARTNCATAVLRKNSSRDGFQRVVMMETAETSNGRLVAQRDDLQVQRRRDRTMNRSEWSSETTTDATS
jgi:hypothetical protein